MDTNQGARLTMDVTEAAKLLGLGRNTVYNAIRAGEIRALRIGRRFVVPQAEMERLLGGRAA